MATKHWSWAHFTTDHQLFRNNNSYKNAWYFNKREEFSPESMALALIDWAEMAKKNVSCLKPQIIFQ